VSPIVASLSVIGETCLPCRYLAMTASTHSIVLAFSRHVTIYRVLNKGLQVLRGYITHLKKQKIPSQSMSGCCSVREISTADALCGSHTFQHNFELFIAQRCALCLKLLVSLESPDRHSLLVAVIPLKSLAKVFRCPHS
jgi:hypothetical protein